jgi:hypothetical protein
VREEEEIPLVVLAAADTEQEGHAMIARHHVELEELRVASQHRRAAQRTDLGLRKHILLVCCA